MDTNLSDICIDQNFFLTKRHKRYDPVAFNKRISRILLSEPEKVSEQYNINFQKGRIVDINVPNNFSDNSTRWQICPNL